MHYHISIADVEQHFIQLTYTISHLHQDSIDLQLPAWRPGRYELQNFAKNVRLFEITDGNGNPVYYRKTTKDRWHVHTKDIQSIQVSYQYYAHQPDAGACEVNDYYLYINPVHCCMYVEGKMDEPYTLSFELPEDYRIASQMTQTGKHQLAAPNFDYLADSPLFASASLEHHQFTVAQTTMHIWFQGLHSFNISRLIEDTTAYTLAQIDVFGDLPCTDYHFLYLMHKTPARHGVEHLDSTVISLGQLADQTQEEFYHDLLAISSHELFHLWNIKRIRPEEMLPYDFTKENYSTLGYVYEGVTTYYGDLMLLQSGVWNWEQYAASLSSDLMRHTTNDGRFNYSVAESSWDTWLDGYVPGIRGRKVSIYIEGMMAAVIADITIITQSKGKYSLHHVMRDLYQKYHKHGKGYSETIYKELLEHYSGISFDAYFNEFIWGKGQLLNGLQNALQLVGCTLQPNKSGYFELTRRTKLSDVEQLAFNKWTSLNI